MLAALLGRRFQDVRIIDGWWYEIDEEISTGRITFEQATETELCSLECCERFILILLAGGFAQQRFSPHSLWRHGMQSDLKTVGNCIAEMGHRGKVAGAYLDYLELRAKALVNEHWASIRAVAAALLENKIINEHAVRQVIAGVEARAAAAARKAVMS